MIEGFINLSTPLKRLGFVKVILWLTHPSSFMYSSQLVLKYKEVVKENRKRFEWNIDPDTNQVIPGSGIGDETLPATEDSIAMDHVLLAQSLGFLRKEVNIWWRFGWHLASQYAGDKGKPVFMDSEKREELMMRKGLIAKLPRSEQFIFCNALLSSDVDGSIPLIECLEEDSIAELRKKYFDSVSNWYARKAEFETNPTRRYFYLKEKSNFAKSETEGGYSKIHRESQILPRLNFLLDVGFVIKNKSRYSLSDPAREFKKRVLSLSDNDLFALLQEKESNLGILLSEYYNDRLDKVTSEQFEEIFYKLSAFYKYIGLIMIPYEDLYFSMTAYALAKSKNLDFSTYRLELEHLAKRRSFYLSTTVPGRKYIKP